MADEPTMTLELTADEAALIVYCFIVVSEIDQRVGAKLRPLRIKLSDEIDAQGLVLADSTSAR